VDAESRWPGRAGAATAAPPAAAAAAEPAAARRDPDAQRVELLAQRLAIVLPRAGHHQAGEHPGGDRPALERAGVAVVQRQHERDRLAAVLLVQPNGLRP